MKKLLLLILVAAAVFAAAVSTASASVPGPCYWPKDYDWHWSPGYQVWFHWTGTDYWDGYAWQRSYLIYNPGGGTTYYTIYPTCPWP